MKGFVSFLKYINLSNISDKASYLRYNMMATLFGITDENYISTSAFILASQFYQHSNSSKIIVDMLQYLLPGGMSYYQMNDIKLKKSMNLQQQLHTIKSKTPVMYAGDNNGKYKSTSCEATQGNIDISVWTNLIRFDIENQPNYQKDIKFHPSYFPDDDKCNRNIMDFNNNTRPTSSTISDKSLFQYTLNHIFDGHKSALDNLPEVNKSTNSDDLPTFHYIDGTLGLYNEDNKPLVVGCKICHERSNPIRTKYTKNSRVCNTVGCNNNQMTLMIPITSEEGTSTVLQKRRSYINRTKLITDDSNSDNEEGNFYSL